MRDLTYKIFKGIAFVIVVVACSTNSFAQNNSLVLNGAITVLDGGTAGAPIYLVVNQNNTAGITRFGGHIHSENQYNFVKWVSGAGTGNYTIPFGVGGVLTDYIPFTFNKTAGNSNIDMSTWTTDQQNMPHAATTNVGPVTSMTGAADSVLYAIDRFWDIQTSAATTADLTFSYLGTENTTSAPTDSVKAMHWNGSSWDAPVGPGNPGVVAGVGTAGPFLAQSTFSPWILSIVSPCPTAVISYPSDYCDNDTATHAITFSGDTTGIFSASPAGLSIDTLTGSIVPANSTAGTYTVTYTIDSSATCPVFTVTTTVIIHGTNATPQSLSICDGDSILLGGAFQTIGGVYIDTLTNINNCDSIVTTTLTIDSLLSIAADTAAPICFGDPLNLTATGSGNGTITWYSDSLGTTVVGTGSPFTPTIPAPGTYTFYVNEDGACPSAMDSVVVVVGGVQAIINANPLTGPVPLSVFFGNGSTTGAGITYFWDFGNGNTSTVFQPTEVYNNEGTYTVMLIVTDGICSDTAYVTIDAYGASAILIPNVFTPNGDGQNDVFTVDGVNLASVQCEIFNRWGQLMYSWDNVRGSWDGRTPSGTEVPDGTYFYMITAKGVDGEEFFKKGAFSLIR
jgi:gliding motility-associated-like protein